MAKELCDSTKKKISNLQQKKLMVMSLINGIQKRGTNTHQKYKYIAIDDVLDSFRVAFIKTRISFYSTIATAVIVNTRLEITVKMSLINVDDPADRECFTQTGISTRLDDTSVGKALAYAVKNGLLKVFLIPGGAGEDVEFYNNQPVKEKAAVKETGVAADNVVATIIEDLNGAEDLEDLVAMWDDVKATRPRAACRKAHPIFLKLKTELSAAK